MRGAHCYGLLEAGWEVVSSRCTVQQRRLELPAGAVCFQCAGFEGRLVTGTFDHLARDVPSAGGLRVCLWFRAGMDSALDDSPPIGVPQLELHGDLDDRFVGHHRPGLTAWLDRRQDRLVGCCDPQCLLPTDRVKPLHGLWLVWHHDRKVPVVHAALVSRDGRGLLVVGPENSGKSTVAAVCLANGMDLVADDQVALIGPRRGAGLYGGIWLESDHAARFGNTLGKGLHHPYEPKTCFLLEPSRLAPEASIEAVLVLRPGRARGPMRMGPATALEALAAASSGTVAAASRSALGRLVETAPCYGLGFCGPDQLWELVGEALGD